MCHLPGEFIFSFPSGPISDCKIKLILAGAKTLFSIILFFCYKKDLLALTEPNQDPKA